MLASISELVAISLSIGSQFAKVRVPRKGHITRSSEAIDFGWRRLYESVEQVAHEETYFGCRDLSCRVFPSFALFGAELQTLGRSTRAKFFSSPS
jgi:hypothetical protein